MEEYSRMKSPDLINTRGQFQGSDSDSEVVLTRWRLLHANQE